MIYWLDIWYVAISRWVTVYVRISFQSNDFWLSYGPWTCILKSSHCKVIQCTSNILGPLIFAAGRGQCIAMCNTLRNSCFPRMTYFWSIVLFRCNDFIRFLYYFWTIPKTLIAQHYYTPAPQRGRGVFIPPLPEGGRGYTDLPLSICPSKIFFVAFFSVTVDGRNLIFGHKHHIGIPYWG